MTKPGFTWVTPVLFVRDLELSLKHYAEVLGFNRTWQWSEERAFGESESPTFACVTRGEYSLFLSQRRDLKESGMVCFNVGTAADLQTLFEEYKASGATIVDEPQDRPFGMRDMVVQDLDGNTFRLGLPTDAATCG